MLIDDERTKQKLSRIVAHLTKDAALGQDLMQEALLLLWLLEEKKPGQTTSWYLQACQYRLTNYLQTGRSVDSWKRRHKRVAQSDSGNGNGKGDRDSANVEDDRWSFVQAEEVHTIASAREIIAMLWGQLDAREREVLTLLSEGYGVRESAAQLQLTHPVIIKCRRKIAALALKLGISPLPPNHRPPRRISPLGKIAQSVAAPAAAAFTTAAFTITAFTVI